MQFRRVMLSVRGGISGSWTAEWSHEFSEFKRPQPIDMGVKLEFKHRKKGLLGIGLYRNAYSDLIVV